MENEKQQKRKQAQKEGSPSQKAAPRMTLRRIFALAGVVLLIALYVATLVVSIVDSSSSGRWLAACLFASVAVPVFLWVYTWLYGRLTGKQTVADFSSGRETLSSHDTAQGPETETPAENAAESAEVSPAGETHR